MQSSVDPSERLAEGNAKFRKSVDSAVLQHLSKGQHPFVAILTCSDARVDPVKVFSLSLGDAFVVRTAGSKCWARCSTSHRAP